MIAPMATPPEPTLDSFVAQRAPEPVRVLPVDGQRMITA